MDVRFTIGMNKQVIDYVEKADQYEYWINYTANQSGEVYNCFFNWSDLMNIPELVFNHGVTDNLFWFRFRKDDVPQNDETMVYVFDPTFGEDTGDGNYAFFTNGGQEYMHGQEATCPVNVWAQNITFIYYTQAGCDIGDYVYAQAGIYEYVDSDGPDFAGAKLGLTEYESRQPYGESYPLTVTLDFETPLLLSKNTKYYIVVGHKQSCTIDVGENVYLVMNDNDRGCYEGGGTPTMSQDPWQGESSEGQDEVVVAYVGYTIANYEPEITNPNPSNNYYNESIGTVICNVTVSDDDGNTSTVDFYTSSDGDSWTWIQTNNSILNESVSFDYIVTEYQTTYYWKVTANDTTDNTTSDIYSFKTTPYRTLFFNDTFLTENWIEISHNMTHETGWENTTNNPGGEGTNVMSWFDSFEGKSHQTPVDGNPSTYWNDGGEEESWWYGEGYTGSSNTGCGIATNANPYHGTYIVYTETSGTTPLDNPPALYSLESDTFTINATENCTVDFAYHMYGDSDFDYCYVQIDDGEGGWDTIWQLDNPSHSGYADSDPWDLATAYSDDGANAPYTGTHKLRFLVNIVATYTGDFCLDAVWVNVTEYSTYFDDAWIRSKSIYKTEDNWDKFYADVDDFDSCQFTISSDVATGSAYWQNLSGYTIHSQADDYDGHTLAEALAGTDYWDARLNDVADDWFILDLGGLYYVNGSRGRTTTTIDPQNISIYVSNDVSDFGEDTRVDEQINIEDSGDTWVTSYCNGTIGRYVKVVVYDNEGTSGEMAWGNTATPVSIFELELIDCENISVNGDGDDISSLTGNYVIIDGNFSDNTVNISSWNISWSSGGEPPVAPDTPIYFDNEDPVNNSIDQELSFTWTCDVTDDEGDISDWYVSCLGFSDSGSSNDTASLSLSGLAYYTEYTVECFGNDSNNYTYEMFKFTTKEEPAEADNPPTIESNWTDGIYEQDISLNFSKVWFNDTEGDIVYNWMNASDGSFWSVNSSNISGYIDFDGLSYYTKYWVNCTSSDNNNQTWANYTFWTENYTPEPADTPPTIENNSIANGSY